MVHLALRKVVSKLYFSVMRPNLTLFSYKHIGDMMFLRDSMYQRWTSSHDEDEAHVTWMNVKSFVVNLNI